MDEGYLRISQVARILNYCTTTIFLWTQKGTIPAHQMGVCKNGKIKWGYLESELQEWQKIKEQPKKHKKVKVRKVLVEDFRKEKLNVTNNVSTQ